MHICMISAGLGGSYCDYLAGKNHGCLHVAAVTVQSLRRDREPPSFELGIHVHSFSVLCLALPPSPQTEN